MCRRKLPPVVKAPLQIRHLNDFSPVCVRTCALSTPAETKPLPHWEHLNGFSPVCDLKQISMLMNEWAPDTFKCFVTQTALLHRISLSSRHRSPLHQQKHPRCSLNYVQLRQIGAPGFSGLYAFLMTSVLLWSSFYFPFIIASTKNQPKLWYTWKNVKEHNSNETKQILLQHVLEIANT